MKNKIPNSTINITGSRSNSALLKEYVTVYTSTAKKISSTIFSHFMIPARTKNYAFDEEKWQFLAKTQPISDN